MNKNPIEELRKLLNKKGELDLELKDVLNECELSMRDKIRNYYLNEPLEETLYPSVNKDDSIYTQSSKTIKQFNLSSLQTLNYLERNNIKQDLVFIDFSQEHFKIKGEKRNKNTNENREDWLGFITNRLSKIANVLSDNGLLFISVDDSLFAETKLIGDKYFSLENYVSTIIFDTPDVSPHIKFLNETKEYVLIYKGKNIQEFNRKRTNKPSEVKYNNLNRTRKYRADYDYAIEIPTAKGEFAYAGGSKEAWEKRQKGQYNSDDWKWMLTEERFKKRLKEGHIKFKKVGDVWKVYNAYNTCETLPLSDRISGEGYLTGKNEVEKYIEKISKRKNKPISFFSYLVSLHPIQEKELAILNLNGDEGSFEEAVLFSNLNEFSMISVVDSEQNTYNKGIPLQKRLYTILNEGSLIFNQTVDFDYEVVDFSNEPPRDEEFLQIKVLENTKHEKELSKNTLLFSNENKDVFILKNMLLEEIETIHQEQNPEKEIVIYLKEKNKEIMKELFLRGLDNIKFI